MSDIDDGDPAFPRDDFHHGIPGMSLRDWFAGHARPLASRSTLKEE